MYTYQYWLIHCIFRTEELVYELHLFALTLYSSLTPYETNSTSVSYHNELY